jgi:hypothetical protein
MGCEQFMQRFAYLLVITEWPPHPAGILYMQAVDHYMRFGSA